MIDQNPKHAPPKSRTGGRNAAAFVKAYWLPIVLVVLAIVFIATNTADTTFNIGWVSITQPLWLLLTVTVLVGFVIGWFVGRRSRK